MMPPTPMIGKHLPSAARSWRITRLLASSTGRAAQATGFLAWGRPLHGIARDGGVGGDHAVHAVALQGGGNHPDLGLVQIGRDLHKNRHPAFAATCVCSCSPATHAARQWLPAKRPALRRFAARAGFGVGRADVDRHVVGMRVDAVQAGSDSRRGIFDGRGGVLADVQAQQHACAVCCLRKLEPAARWWMKASSPRC
jgi:hypothetical protein